MSSVRLTRPLDGLIWSFVEEHHFHGVSLLFIDGRGGISVAGVRRGPSPITRLASV